jgi:hypothetical protein
MMKLWEIDAVEILLRPVTSNGPIIIILAAHSCEMAAKVLRDIFRLHAGEAVFSRVGSKARHKGEGVWTRGIISRRGVHPIVIRAIWGDKRSRDSVRELLVGKTKVVLDVCNVGKEKILKLSTENLLIQRAGALHLGMVQYLGDEPGQSLFDLRDIDHTIRFCYTGKIIGGYS